MARTRNTAPYKVQAKNARGAQVDIYHHLDGTKERYLRWMGGQWRGVKGLRKKAERRLRREFRDARRDIITDADDVALTDKHRHGGKWDLY